MNRRKPSLAIVPSAPLSPETDATPLSVTVRGIRTAGAAGTKIDGDAAAALTSAISLDVSKEVQPVITWRGTDAAVAIDIDRPDDADPVRSVDVASYFPASLPKPLAAWATHGGGLRALFISVGGAVASALAGVWALLAPLGRLAAWRMEALTWTRHPHGARGAEKCGRVHWFSPSTNLILPGDHTACVASDQQVCAWLEDQGLAFGRHPTTNCPLCHTTRKSSGSDPIVISDRGIRCFKCSEFRSWDHLVGIEPHGRNGLRSAARALVHFPHQKHVLHNRRPAVPHDLLRPAWEMIVGDANRDRLAMVILDGKGKPTQNPWAPKVRLAAGSTIDLVRSASGAWLDAATLTPRKVGKATAGELPACFDGVMVDKVLDTVPLEGFTPIVAINADTLIAPHFRAASGSIAVRRQSEDKVGPVDVERRPEPAAVEAAWARLAVLLPGLNRGYASGLVTATMLAQCADGPPPILAVTGDTGSAKTATQHLVGSMVGGGAVNVTFGRDADTARRSIGLALEKEGASLLFVDEIGRVPDLYEKLATVFELGSTLRYAAKYHNEYTTQVTAPFSILGSTMPEMVVSSPELSRRAVGWRLTEPAVGWRRHGDIRKARHVEALRLAIDVVVADLWWLVFDLGPNFDWRSLCLGHFGAVELQELNIEDSGGDGRAAAVRALYQEFIDATPADMTTCGGRPGWLNADPGTAAFRIIEEIVDTEADHKRTRAEVSELERLSLAPVLGFAAPSMKLLIRRRSAHWFLKFTEIGVRKGAETRRKELPPLGALDAPGQPSGQPASGEVALDALDALKGTVPSALSAVGSTTPLTSEVDRAASSATGASHQPADTTSLGGARVHAVVVNISHRSLAKLNEIGGSAYAKHPTTEILHVAVWLHGDAVMSLRPAGSLPQVLLDAIAAGSPLVAHDAVGVQQHLWERLGWPTPGRWIDTLPLMRIAGLPDTLADVAAILDPPSTPPSGLADLRDAQAIDPRTGLLPALGRPAFEQIAAADQQTVKLVQRLARQRLRRWLKVEPDLREVDCRINQRGFAFDEDLADSVLELTERAALDARDAAPVAGSVLDSPSRLRAWLEDSGIVVPDVRHQTLIDLLDNPELSSGLRLALEARLTSSSIASNKLRAGLRHVAPDGRIRWSLVYAAAHTGRWGGRGFQPQNLPRGHGGVLDMNEVLAAARARNLARIGELAAAAGLRVDAVLATLVRPCIWAGPEKELATVDYAGVEARALRWLADDKDGLEAFRQSIDLYRRMAAKLFAIDAEAVSAPQRQLGKALELGSGYQMGPHRFEMYAESFGIDWSAIGLSAAQAVESWRDGNPKIAGSPVDGASIPHRDGGLWHAFDRAARAAATNGVTTTVGRCVWRRSGNDVLCELPSGRDLVYLNVRVEDVERAGRKRPTLTYQRGRTRISTFGGKLVENVTQAVCRDLLAESLVRLDAAGHHVVLHVHDEVVCEVTHTDELQAIVSLMEVEPTWAQGLPIRAVGTVTPRYGK